METTPESKEKQTRTTAHGLKFLQIFTRKEKIVLSVTAILVFAFLAFSSYYTSVVIFAGIFFLVAFLGWGFYWRKVCRDRLIKLYYLYKETPDVYLWVETWDLKEKYMYSNPDYYWMEKTELVRVFDTINSVDIPDDYHELFKTKQLYADNPRTKYNLIDSNESENNTLMPRPFRPFDEELGTVTSIDLARTQEQSAAERLFTSMRKNWNEVLKLGMYVVIIIALIVGCIALLGN